MAAEETQNKCNEQVTYVFKIKHSYNYKYVLKKEHFGLTFFSSRRWLQIADTTTRMIEKTGGSLIRKVVKTNCSNKRGEKTKFI